MIGLLPLLSKLNVTPAIVSVNVTCVPASDAGRLLVGVRSSVTVVAPTVYVTGEPV